MEKKEYMTPMVEMTVIEVEHVLATSDPVRNVPWWSGEGDAPKRRGRNEWSDGWED